MYYTYMLRCEDNSIYTGIAANLDSRMKEHFSKDEKCAKYTKSHSAKKLEAAWESEDRKLATKMEYHIKKLTRTQKEELIKNNKLEYLSNKIEIEKYTRIAKLIL